jgi:hypothetical protein
MAMKRKRLNKSIFVALSLSMKKYDSNKQTLLCGATRLREKK